MQFTRIVIAIFATCMFCLPYGQAGSDARPFSGGCSWFLSSDGIHNIEWDKFDEGIEEIEDVEYDPVVHRIPDRPYEENRIPVPPPYYPPPSEEPNIDRRAPSDKKERGVRIYDIGGDADELPSNVIQM